MYFISGRKLFRTNVYLSKYQSFYFRHSVAIGSPKVELVSGQKYANETCHPCNFLYSLQLRVNPITRSLYFHFSIFPSCTKVQKKMLLFSDVLKKGFETPSEQQKKKNGIRNLEVLMFKHQVWLSFPSRHQVSVFVFNFLVFFHKKQILLIIYQDFYKKNNKKFFTRKQGAFLIIRTQFDISLIYTSTYYFRGNLISRKFSFIYISIFDPGTNLPFFMLIFRNDNHFFFHLTFRFFVFLVFFMRRWTFTSTSYE